jgi:hypothetical protein
VRKVLTSWGPGRFDAELDKDGKAFRPDGKQAGTLIPPAFGLAGVNLHTWTGFGSVPYWNAYVGVGEMHGSGTFLDARFNDKDQYPVAAKSGAGNTRGTPDRLTSKLAALHFYQLSIPAPKAPVGSYDKAAFERGMAIFNGPAKCATCHVPTLFTEPGNNLHAPTEIGVDSFQADRSPTHMYRTAPLAGLWSHQKGGFYHDGRFATLLEVVNHYNTQFTLELSNPQKERLDRIPEGDLSFATTVAVGSIFKIGRRETIAGGSGAALPNVRLVRLTPKLLKETSQTAVIRGDPGQTLGVVDHRVGVSRVAAEIDERQKGIAIIWMPCQFFL